MVIIGILICIAVPIYFSMLQQGAANAAEHNLVTIYNAENSYYFSNGSYCIASCDSLPDINLAANLNLNLTDSYFNYTCNNVPPSGSGFSCTATGITNGITLTVKGGITNNLPIVLPGGVGCTTTAGANCNPSCSPVTSTKCPSS